MFTRIDCLFKGFWRSLVSFIKTGDATPIDGHDYIDEKIIEGATVIISKCEHCGKREITWSREYLPEHIRKLNPSIITKGKVCGHICNKW